MIYFILGFLLSLLSGGNVSTVHDMRQDIENIYRVITIPIDTTMQDDDEGYTEEGEYIENLNLYRKE